MVRPPYQVAVRLCDLAAQRWPELAAAYYQINLTRQKPYQFANLVYAWAVERVPADEMEDFHFNLNDLLPWQSGDSEAAVELESASFFKMMATQPDQ